MFGDPCPGTEKYLEVHYSCVSRQNISTPRVLVPPWFLDIAVTPPASYTRDEEDIGTTTEQTVAVIASTVDNNIPEAITYRPIHQWLKLGESENYSVSVDDSTNIVICVTISAISCVILVTIYIIIQRHHSSADTPAARCSCSHNSYHLSHSVYPALPITTKPKLRAEENIKICEKYPEDKQLQYISPVHVPPHTVSEKCHSYCEKLEIEHRPGLVHFTKRRAKRSLSLSQPSQIRKSKNFEITENNEAVIQFSLNMPNK